MPTAGTDYPQNLVEFGSFFPDEEACHRFLEHLRWPGGFVCPQCKQAAPGWRMGNGLYLCSKCRKQISTTAGTIFEGTRKPLLYWLLAAWEITSQKYGASALGIQRILGLKSYETAWAWLHKFRRAMVRPDRDRLSGVLEVDETYLGGEEAAVRGRQTVSKAIVAIAVELKEGRIGRIRLRHVPDVSGSSLVSFVKDVAAPGSTVQTDGWPGYAGLAREGFYHQVTVLSSSPDPAHVLMPSVHRVSALLKRWWLGIHQGATSTEHLAYYLDEYTFRFNRRTSGSRGLLFYRLIEQSVRIQHVSTDELFQGTGRGPTHGRNAARQKSKAFEKAG
jgi:transposase-like protein